MSLTQAPTSILCPNCHQPMQGEDFARHDHGVVRVHLCFVCAGIWFDQHASVQLAPAAVIDLFREIHAHREGARQPLASRLACPRCRNSLALNFDLCKAGRFSYYACAVGDGRFTPFFQFLREKQFVRTLTPMELQRIRSQVRQIKCSDCGAPIDLEHDNQCKFCHSPVSFLDSEAVERAMQMWSDADHRRNRNLGPSSAAVGEALQHSQLRQAEQPGGGSGVHLTDRLLLARNDGHFVAGIGLDLIAWGIDSIGRLFEH